ncbi:MAG: division/cell wall cluster transcriptional repressor MraZ [Chlamydiota bacterium]
MFCGQFRHSIDNKGRLIIPAKFRDTLRESFIEKFWVTRGIERCVCVYTPREWNELISKLKELPSFSSSKARDFQRGLISNAAEVECDKQGRIMLPQNLLALAGITRDVVVAGNLTRFEIWDEESWKKYQEERASNFEEIAEQLNTMGI